MNKAAIYYHPDGFRTDRKTLMGRHAAGEGFLRGYLRHSESAEFACAAETEAHAKEFMALAQELRPDSRSTWLKTFDNPGLQRWGTLVLPGPDLPSAAWRRRRGAQSAYSLVGVTHTTATHRATDMIADTAIAPVQVWDALICTSRAVKAMVEQLLDDHAAYLIDRLGANRITRPQLPVIPLGVDADALGRAREHRTEWRGKLGIGADEPAVLFFGRLSLHGKAHPSPLYAALQLAKSQLAAEGRGERVHLILGGWFANDGQEAMFRSEAARLAPDIVLHVVDGRTPEARAGLWGAADIFTLLSDNIQETFGLAPVEAMAAGLPVVISDWDGFRDTVEDGVQGFRIRTRLPPPGYGRDLAVAFEDGREKYDGYIAAAAQFCAVDVRAAATAFLRLLSDAEFRRTMGEAARKRAVQLYDWGVIIKAYQALWAELETLRSAADERAPLRPGAEPHPLRSDPLRLFRSYPSTHLGPNDKLALTGRCDSAGAGDLLKIPSLAPRIQALASADEIAKVLKAVGEGGPLACSALLSGFESPRRPIVFRTLLWLLKHDVLRTQP